jgi:hypothetical protein
MIHLVETVLLNFEFSFFGVAMCSTILSGDVGSSSQPQLPGSPVVTGSCVAQLGCSLLLQIDCWEADDVHDTAAWEMGCSGSTL